MNQEHRHHGYINPQMNILNITDMSNKMRRAGRLKTEQITCSLGDVEDLSVQGVRLRGRKQTEGETVELSFHLHGLTTTVLGRVIWSKPLKRRTHLSGIEFIDVPACDQSILAQMAMSDRLPDHF